MIASEQFQAQICANSISFPNPPTKTASKPDRPLATQSPNSTNKTHNGPRDDPLSTGIDSGDVTGTSSESPKSCTCPKMQAMVRSPPGFSSGSEIVCGGKCWKIIRNFVRLWRIKGGVWRPGFVPSSIHPAGQVLKVHETQRRGHQRHHPVTVCEGDVCQLGRENLQPAVRADAVTAEPTCAS